MKRETNAPSLACGHPMCEPGSEDCRRREADHVLGLDLARGVDNARSIETTVGTLSRVLAGRPLYTETPPARRVIDWDLIDQVVEDARQQLANVEGTATLMHRGRPELTEQAVALWHRNNPGLSRLLQLTDQT